MERSSISEPSPAGTAELVSVALPALAAPAATPATAAQGELALVETRGRGNPTAQLASDISVFSEEGANLAATAAVISGTGLAAEGGPGSWSARSGASDDNTSR